MLANDVEFGDRFWYWRGASGKRYIHSVYPADTCPPLPGGVYVAVRRMGDKRVPLRAGLFGVLDGFAGLPPSVLAGGCTEIHVHLLADSAFGAREVLQDLTVELFGEPVEPDCPGQGAGMARVTCQQPSLFDLDDGLAVSV